jgi:hypothetical protein
MNLIKTIPGVLINLDQVWMVEITSDKILFHYAPGAGMVHQVEKKRLPEGEWERITKAIQEKSA